ncbi:MAG: hypothetical protein J2P49_00290 [Methylocapsa sp.]|nr:hypothetical protein [Methylocapsa sp.]
MIEVDATLLREIAPRATGERKQKQAQIIAAVGKCCTAALDKYASDTRLRIGHFLSRTFEESGGFRTTVSMDPAENTRAARISA